jgi:alpha/beta superfamily hydrolase
MMTNRKPIRHVDLYSDAGRLEALYRDIENPAAVAVIAHPHPLHGGTLHNKVVFRAARGLENADVATLRFNFRGAGTSHGEHDFGDGEKRDMEAALTWITKKHPGVKLIAGGFSFGSWVASQVACDRPDVTGVFLLGAPITKYDLHYLRYCEKPIFFLQGAKDEFGDADKLAELVGQCRNAESLTVNDADHFFAGQLDLVEQAMQEWTESILSA